MASASDLNPLKIVGADKFSVGLGTFGDMFLLVIIVTLIFILVGVMIYFYYNRRQYKYSIPLYMKIGNVPTRVATYKAKDVPMGRAGDKLWYIKGIKKFIPPATIQSAPREFFFWQREDGEWVNFSIGDLDKDSKRTGVKYVHQDMRLQRLATDKLLEQRLMNKSFLEKYGLILSYVIFFLVITVAMVVIFWQWGKIIEGTASLLTSLDNMLDKANQLQGGSSGDELIPALSLLLFWRRKNAK